MNSASTLRLLVHPRHRGLRLDLFLAAASDLSRRGARRAISDGQVLRNGAPARVQSRLVDTADVIELHAAESTTAVESEPIPELHVLHQDDWMLAVAKPAGLLSQPVDRPGEHELAADDAVRLRLAASTGRRPTLHLAHRLDRVTSGVLLFSCRDEANAALARSWSAGRVERRYLAVVEGLPDFSQREVDEPIGRDGPRWRFAVKPEGKPARTDLEVLARGDGWAVVECRPRTGRTHQVRVHLAHVGLPVMGDRLYGARPAGTARRPLLHAAGLALPHPRDGRRTEIEAPAPADMRFFLDTIEL